MGALIDGRVLQTDDDGHVYTFKVRGKVAGVDPSDWAERDFETLPLGGAAQPAPADSQVTNLDIELIDAEDRKVKITWDSAVAVDVRAATAPEQFSYSPTTTGHPQNISASEIETNSTSPDQEEYFKIIPSGAPLNLSSDTIGIYPYTFTFEGYGIHTYNLPFAQIEKTGNEIIGNAQELIDWINDSAGEDIVNLFGYWQPPNKPVGFSISGGTATPLHSGDPGTLGAVILDSMIPYQISVGAGGRGKSFVVVGKR